MDPDETSVRETKRKTEPQYIKVSSRSVPVLSQQQPASQPWKEQYTFFFKNIFYKNIQAKLGKN